MAMSLNRAQIIGNLTRDPEVRQTPSGQSVASFAVATNFTWNDSNGQKQEKVEFHNIVAWGKLAEICGTYLKKGQKVFMEGRLQTRDWEGEDGVKRYRTEIVAENMIMLSPKGQTMGNESGYSSNSDMTNPAVQDKRPESIAKSDSGSSVTPVSKGAEAADEDVVVEDLPF